MDSKREEVEDSRRKLYELFDYAWELNKSDETRTDLSKMCTSYISGIIQDFQYMANRIYDKN